MSTQHYKRRDEIESELEELKNRKCKNCKYFEIINNDFAICTGDTPIDSLAIVDDMVAFACNVWSKK